MRGAWWAEGVQFTCQPDCGRCCDEPGGIVYLSRNDVERLAQHANLTVPEYLKKDCTTTLDGRYVLRSNQSDGICIYLDENKHAPSTKFAHSNAKRSRGGLKIFEVSDLGNKSKHRVLV